ncbi:hypothetical protein GIB67_017600 [Kingdonia uniflora]|uniref:H15 domain-containing protein n=1 Tax=Kingdonia uniflora TaxID=39325 RepID=A0A7J7LN62_9MAGN|nr:hypothetical protein GIB67_017600 [Kingdonia uniflora]
MMNRLNERRKQSTLKLVFSLCSLLVYVHQIIHHMPRFVLLFTQNNVNLSYFKSIFAQMITGAIRELNETRGSSEASISRYIKSNYQDLPFAHPHFLTIHIENLLEMEEIVSATNASQRYFLPDHNPNLKNEQEQQKKKKGSSRRKSSKRSKLKTDEEKQKPQCLHDEDGLVVSAKDTHRAKKRKPPTDKEAQLVQCFNDDDELLVLIEEDPREDVIEIEPLHMQLATTYQQGHVEKSVKGKYPKVVMKNKEIILPCQEQQPKYCPRPRLYPPSVSQSEQPQKGRARARLPSLCSSQPEQFQKEQASPSKKTLQEKFPRRALVIDSEGDKHSTIVIKFDGEQPLGTTPPSQPEQSQRGPERPPKPRVQGGSPDLLQKKKLLKQRQQFALVDKSEEFDPLTALVELDENQQQRVISPPLQPEQSQSGRRRPPRGRGRGGNADPSPKALIKKCQRQALVEENEEDKHSTAMIELNEQRGIASPFKQKQPQRRQGRPPKGKGRGQGRGRRGREGSPVPSPMGHGRGRGRPPKGKG